MLPAGVWWLCQQEALTMTELHMEYTISYLVANSGRMSLFRTLSLNKHLTCLPFFCSLDADRYLASTFSPSEISQTPLEMLLRITPLSYSSTSKYVLKACYGHNNVLDTSEHRNEHITWVLFLT